MQVGTRPQMQRRINLTRAADENRQRLIERDSLRSIIVKLDNINLTSVAIPVLYNICFDYGGLHQSSFNSVACSY